MSKSHKKVIKAVNKYLIHGRPKSGGQDNKGEGQSKGEGKGENKDAYKVTEGVKEEPPIKDENQTPTTKPPSTGEFSLFIHSNCMFISQLNLSNVFSVLAFSESMSMFMFLIQDIKQIF